MYKKQNRIKNLIKKDKTAFGSFISIPSVEVVEILGHVGFDFVVIDDEHGCFGRESIRNLILAARSVGIDCLVRIPENNSTLISQTLDDGADGIIISHIETAEEAVKMVQAAKYYPQGTRSIAQTNRATSYKIVDQSEYICLANAETIVVVLIESQTGMNNLEKILKVSGLDAVLLGQRDLAQSLGLADDIQNPLIIENFQKMIKLSRNAGLSAMVSVSFAKEAVPFIELGARLIIIGKDMRFLYRVYEKELQNTKDYDRNR